MNNHFPARRSSFLRAVLCAGALIGLAACAGNSPFEAASTAKAGDGKIPVSVTASATASGNTAANSATDYTGGVAVTFGADVAPQDEATFIDAAQSTGLPVKVIRSTRAGIGAVAAFGKNVSSDARNRFLTKLFKKRAASSGSGGSFWAHFFGTDAAPAAYDPVASAPFAQN